MPSDIRQRMPNISLDDSAGYVRDAQTAVDLAARERAEKVHVRTTAELRRQREDATSAIPDANRQL